MTRSLDTIILRYVGYALLFAFAAYLLYLVRAALPIFGVAALLAYALEPLLQRLEKRGYSRRGAVGFIFLVFVLLIVVLVALLVLAWQQVITFSEKAPTYQRQFAEVVAAGQKQLDSFHLPDDVRDSINDGIHNYQSNVLRQIPSRVQDVLAWIVGSLGYFAIILVVLPILTLWFMIEMNPLRARLLMLVPPLQRRAVTDIGRDINDLLGRYVRGQMIICGLFGLLCTITFYILQFAFDMQYALILGLAAVFLYIVPYLGMATIALSAGLTAYFTSDNPVLCAVLAVSSCVLFNLILDYGVAPRVLGQGTGLHPLMIIFALLAGAQLGGIMGMILAVPFFASLRVIAMHLFPQLSVPIPESPPEIDATTKQEATEKVVRQTQEAEATSGIL